MLDEDRQLIVEFAATGSQEAFARLVRRHIDMIYSVARRGLDDIHLAEDVTQAVFFLLARKAKTLRSDVILAGWLFNVTRYVAADVLRRRRRQIRREKEAVMARQPQGSESTKADWEKISPALNDAVAALGNNDRNAIVLRFFEGRSHAEVGRALGVSEDAAKMRISRSLCKLRKKLARRGVSTAAPALAAVLTAKAILTSPPALAAASSNAASGATAVVASAIARHALRTMQWGKIEIFAAVAAGFLIVGGSVPIALRQLMTPPPSIAAPSATAAPTLTSQTSLPARRFRSTLRLLIYLEDPRDMPMWDGKFAGGTPSAKGVPIPADTLWCVSPDPSVARQLLVKEINAQRIPGLDLEVVPPAADLSFLQDLNGLRVLVMYGPGVTDAGLDYLRGLTSLEELYLEGTKVTDEGLECLTGLTSLRKLDLSGTQVSGPGLKYLKTLNALQSLSLGWLPLTDANLEPIGEIISLRALHLGYTKITDAGLAHLEGLTNLRTLQVTGDTHVTDAGMEHLTRLTALHRLILPKTGVTDAGAAILKQALPDCDIIK